MTEATGSQEKPNQDYEKMSVDALRQIVGGIPGVSRRIRRGDGNWRERTKDELIAAIRASSSGGGDMSVGSGATSSSAAAERPQPLAGSEAPAGRSFFSSGERSGAKNAGVSQNKTDAPHEKTTDESNTFEMCTQTELRVHASRVAGLSKRHASGKCKTNMELISELKAWAIRKQSRPLMAAFQAGSASTGLSLENVPAQEGPLRKDIVTVEEPKRRSCGSMLSRRRLQPLRDCWNE